MILELITHLGLYRHIDIKSYEQIDQYLDIPACYQPKIICNYGQYLPDVAKKLLGIKEKKSHQYFFCSVEDIFYSIWIIGEVRKMYVNICRGKLHGLLVEVHEDFIDAYYYLDGKRSTVPKEALQTFVDRYIKSVIPVYVRNPNGTMKWKQN